MIVRIIGLVFLFIIRIRFPKGKSIADIIRNRYGESFVKKIRRFEKCDFKLRKCHLDLRFLLDCKKNGVIPKFLRFKLANRHLKNSHVYKKCQIRLLEEEIKSKRKRINTLEKDTQRVKEELQRTLSVLDFSYICSLFLVANDKSILHHDNIQKRKISSNNIFSDSHNPDRVIFNFSSYELTDEEKNVLCKGLNFSVNPGWIEYSEFLLPFELLFRDIKREDLCNKDMSLIKARLLDTALTSYQNFSSDKDPPENLTPSEFKALKRLSKNKIWVDKGSEFYNAYFNKWLRDNDIVMYSTHNEGKSVVAERFIRTLKSKIYKYMTSISKNVDIDKLDDIVDEYNNTYHTTIKMKPIDVKDNTYINTSKEINNEDLKFKVGDHVRISKYKNIFAKGYMPNWSEEVFVIKKKLKILFHGLMLLMI